MIKSRSLGKKADDGLIGIIAIIIMMIVFVVIIFSIVANIVPIAIFLVLAIIFTLIIKNVLYGGKGLGIIHGAGGVAKSAGKEGVGLIKAAGREYGHYKNKEGW